ncbi:MAG: SCP2 sterol-binding domain-containing protein [Holophagaceae bacterium]|nr:SCP2 sterol-binding domain-containing protein [Holophagaceae bacterium]
MALTVDGIFSSMPELFQPDKAVGVNASVAYKVTGEGGGDYTCVIAEGAFTLLKEFKADASSTVQITAEDWIALNEGKLDAMQAFMSGKLKGAGDLMLLQKFPKFFKKPEVQKGPQAPLKELTSARLKLVNLPIRVLVGAEAFGEGDELKGEESAVRGLLTGLQDPGPALLSGQIRFSGDMTKLRAAWKTWSQNPEIVFPATPGGKALATLSRRYTGGASGTLELKLDGAPYTLSFTPDHLSVRPGECDGVHTVSLTDGDFAALNVGKLNLVGALLSGQASFKGDFTQVAAYTGLFDAAVNPAQAILESMPDRFDKEKAGDLEAVVGYKLEDLEYTLVIHEGHCAVMPRLLSPADTTLTAKPDDFTAMSTGQLKAQEAFMSGKIKVEGDPLLMQKVAKSFRRVES